MELLGTHKSIRMMAVVWERVTTACSLRLSVEYRAGAAVGMTRAMAARKSREQLALLMATEKDWVL